MIRSTLSRAAAIAVVSMAPLAVVQAQGSRLHPARQATPPRTPTWRSFRLPRTCS
jgi:hypothetical protein